MAFIVVMAGGSGTRFWPRSRQSRPKQFLVLTGKTSLLQRTYATALKIVARDHVYISTASKHSKLVMRQIPSVSKNRMMIEPVGRDTGPSVALSCMILSRIAGEDIVVFLPADHWITPESAFILAIRQAIMIAERSNKIVTIGIPPTHPSTAYGYIHFGERACDRKAREVLQFSEKPDKKTATRYVSTGQYYWNSGIFVTRISVMLREISLHAPDIYDQIVQLRDTSRSQFNRKLCRVFPQVCKISIDYAVMEKTANVVVVPASFKWDDLGSWDSIAKLLPKRSGDNYSPGSIISIDSCGNIIMNEGKLTALVGVKDLVLVEDKDTLLVCNRHDAQKVKQLTDLLRSKGLKRYL